MKEIFASAVQVAKEKNKPFSGGRDIMKRLVERQRTVKKKPKQKGYFTDGWGIVKKWQEKQQNKPPTETQPGISDGFDIMRQIKEHPVPIKTKESLMEPIEENPKKKPNNRKKF